MGSSADKEFNIPLVYNTFMGGKMKSDRGKSLIKLSHMRINKFVETH